MKEEIYTFLGHKKVKVLAKPITIIVGKTKFNLYSYSKKDNSKLDMSFNWFIIDKQCGKSLGLGSTLKYAIANVKENINKLGIRKTKVLLKKQLTIDKQVKEFEQIHIDKNRIFEISKEIKINIPIDKTMLLFNKVKIDIFKFNDNLGVPNDISLDDFILNKYGQDIRDRIKVLI